MTSRPVPCFPSRRAGLLAAALSGAVACAPVAHAARVTISGEDLDLTIPCTGEVRVKVDPNMKDGATLDSSSLTQVAMHASKEDSGSRISLATRACSPNGRLALTVSANTGVTIHDSHDTHFIITGTLASLDASLDSTTMDIDDTQSLDLRMQGASSVHIKSLERAAQIVASGTSSLTADTVQLAALSAQLTQDATMTLSGGSIDALTLVTADRAGATILGQATVATVAANGSGAVNIQTVTGPMVRSGTGTVHVGAPNGVIYRPTPAPPTSAPPTSAPPTSAPQPPTSPGAPPAVVPAPVTPTPLPPVSTTSGAIGAGSGALGTQGSGTPDSGTPDSGAPESDTPAPSAPTRRRPPSAAASPGPTQPSAPIAQPASVQPTSVQSAPAQPPPAATIGALQTTPSGATSDTAAAPTPSGTPAENPTSPTGFASGPVTALPATIPSAQSPAALHPSVPPRQDAPTVTTSPATAPPVPAHQASVPQASASQAPVPQAPDPQAPAPTTSATTPPTPNGDGTQGE